MIETAGARPATARQVDRTWGAVESVVNCDDTFDRAARSKVSSQFTTDSTAPHVLSTCRAVAGRAPAVSIIVPNYNHARYLPERLSSIFNQTFRDFEVILLDDASTDGSVDELE